MSTVSLADELRLRDDESLGELFRARPDLLAPVPSDFASLAARANSMPSLLRAIEALNKWQYDILIASSALAEPFTGNQLTDVTSKEALKALHDLVARALLYRDGERFRLPSNLRSLLGEEPAGLGPRSPLEVDLTPLNEAPKNSLEVLARLVWGPPRGQIADIKKPGPAIGWLLEKKLLLPLDSHTVVLPREVAIHLRGGKIFKELNQLPPEVKGANRKQKDVDQAAVANISTLLRWVEELAHSWSDDPPTALKTGGLGVRDLKRSAEHLGVEESTAAFVAELLYLTGLVVIDTDEQILPTNAFDLWLTKSEEERWESLVTSWIESSRVSGLIGKSEGKNIAALGSELDRVGVSAMRKNTLTILNEHREIDPKVDSLQAHMKWLAPQRFINEYLEWTLREAEWLGLTGQGAISSFASALITGSKKLGVGAALPKPIDHILLQGDNSAIAPGPLTLEIANTIGTIADIESRGGATVYRFSEASIRRGLDHGRTGDEIKDFLRRTSKTPMPQPLEYLVTDVAKRHGKLRVGKANCYIRCEDESLIQQILHDKKVAELRLRKLAPQVMISELELHDVLIGLREAGYLPAMENAGGILISQPAVRRAKSRPRPPRVLSEPTKANDVVLQSAVRAIRAGERATANRPREIPRTSANETLDLLNQYIQEQASLTIGYADTNGGVSNRLIDPLSISLGTLIARDHATGELAHFRIPRITGVAPAQPDSPVA